MMFPARMWTAPILRVSHTRGLSVLAQSGLRLRPPISDIRQLSTSSPRHAQYVRFPSEQPRHAPGGAIDRRIKIVIALAAVGGTYYIAQYVQNVTWDALSHFSTSSLEQVPETGRWRFMDISPEYETKVRASFS